MTNQGAGVGFRKDSSTSGFGAGAGYGNISFLSAFFQINLIMKVL